MYKNRKFLAIAQGFANLIMIVRLLGLCAGFGRLADFLS